MAKTETNLTIPDDLQSDQLSCSKMNFFFIKSKHAFRHFKNHDYFQSKRSHAVEEKALRSTQFVNSPAPFGINNAYDYICTEVSRNLLAKSQNDHRNKICSVREATNLKPKTPTFSSVSKRKASFQLPNLPFQSKRVHTQEHPSRPLFASKPKTEQLVSLLFVDRSSPSKYLTYELRLNIYPYIINTFLKSKLNYNEMTEEQYAQLKSYIADIYSINKEYVEYKDMVNMKSMKELFLTLENTSDVIYKQEMIRYFFVANQLAYEYQFRKIKDQLKKVIEYQLNKDALHQDIYILRLDNAQEINNLHELMQERGKFIFGTDKKALTDYRTYLREKDVQNEFAIRIKKWKSIVPESTSTVNSFKAVSNQRYERLFKSVQKRRNKIVRLKKNETPAVRSSQFIDRQKLCKQTNIFE